MSVNHSQWTTQYHIWYLGELTLQGEADVCVRGLEDEEVGPQHSLWTGGGPALPSETPANSGKSDIFTSNGTRSICAGLDIPAKFGADLVPLKPVVQSQSKLDEKWIKVRETVCRKKKKQDPWAEVPGINQRKANNAMSDIYLFSVHPVSSCPLVCL